jgi:glycosyltransferase involved in cell wall biosynthesis
VLCRIIQPAIRQSLKKSGTDVVLGTLPDDVYLVGGFLAAKSLGLPFYAHMHDLWTENMRSNTPLGRFAEQWEPLILRQATRVLCMTEAMQEHYRKKYRIETDLLPHCVAETDYLTAPTEMCIPKMSKVTALFVGSVSPPMNLDALKVLASASELLPPEYELLYCTAVDLATLNHLGVCSSRLRVKYVTRAEVQRIQSEAHVLVAPLSHKNCSTAEVRTVFSTKLLEYLIAGRPIVVFAPDGSYHAESASKKGWGFVVSEDSPAKLAAAVVRVATDEDLAARLVRGALKEAQSRLAGHHAGRLREWVLADAEQYGRRRPLLS